MDHRKITVQGNEIILFYKNESDYISLTDIARYKNKKEPNEVIKNWMRSRSTIEFLGLWESLNNSNFKEVEFDLFRANAGSNYFTLSPGKWIESTNAIGIIAKSGKNGGTYSHKDIAFEFASWISPQFKLYLIKEFERLKQLENLKLKSGWNIRRELAKINYKIHTDAVKNHLIPPKLSYEEIISIYATEADLLNIALFGISAKEWRDANPKSDGNIRDHADITQLVCLTNLETLNAEFIRQGINQPNRLIKLNEIAIIHMNILTKNPSVKKLHN